MYMYKMAYIRNACLFSNGKDPGPFMYVDFVALPPAANAFICRCMEVRRAGALAG